MGDLALMGENINIDLKEMKLKDVDWIHLAQHNVQWLALVNTVMSLQFRRKLVISRLTESLLPSQETFCFMGLIMTIP
jgi:hypothetical protein